MGPAESSSNGAILTEISKVVAPMESEGAAFKGFAPMEFRKLVFPMRPAEPPQFDGVVFMGPAEPSSSGVIPVKYAKLAVPKRSADPPTNGVTLIETSD